MVGQRYYSPELCRFIQPADVSTLSPSSINGLNLYSCANNNPIGIAYGISSVFEEVSSFSITKPGVKLEIDNYWNPHWENKCVDTDVPEFFNFTYDKIEFVNWSFSVYKGSLYLDHYEKHSLYIAGGNISTYLGIGSECWFGFRS